MMGPKIYLPLRIKGEAFFSTYIDKIHDLTQSFYQAILNDTHFESPHFPESNILCFRYISTELNNEDTNSLNEYIRTRILENGNFYIVQTKLNNNVYLRVTLINGDTNSTDLNDLITEIQTIAKSTLNIS